MNELTREAVLAMGSGPEMDALIGELMPDHWMFQCPECRSRHFGSHTIDGDVRVRDCHDEFDRGCRWSGPDSECKARRWWSSDIGEAWLVAMEIGKRDLIGVAWGQYGNEGIGASVETISGIGCSADTAALAICRARLLIKIRDGK